VGAGLMRVADAESGFERWIDTDTRAWAEHVRSHAARSEAELQAVLRRTGTERVRLVAGESFVVELERFFRRRARKLVWA